MDDKDAFLIDLWVPSLVLDLPDDIYHLVDLCNSTLRELVDDVPLRTTSVVR